MASTPRYAYANASTPTIKTQIVAGDGTNKLLIRKVTFINNSGGPLTVNLWLDSPGTIEVLFIPSKTISHFQIWSCIDIEGHVIEANGNLSVKASGANLAMVVSTIFIT